jgi:hypothetical protein
MGKLPLSQALKNLVTNNRRDAHNILITPRLLPQDTAQLRLLLNKGVSVLVVALVWEEAAAETVNVATALGCQVVELRPGQSIAGALYSEVGGGAARR